MAHSNDFDTVKENVGQNFVDGVIVVAKAMDKLIYL